MRKILSLILIAAIAASCTGSKAPKSLPGLSKGTVDSASYAIGVSFAQMLKQANMQVINMSELEKGLQEAYDGEKNLKVSEEMIGAIIQNYMIKHEAASEILEKEKEDKFFKENGGKDSVVTVESGLQYKLINEGNAQMKPREEDTVEVHYLGTLLDGTVFDSSYERGPEPVKFPLNGVIRGWREGMQYVGEGGKIKLWIPFGLGYGGRALGPNLPAFSTLVFEVELLKVHRAAESQEK